MSDDTNYFANYEADTLYVFPDSRGKGAYANLVGEGETVIGEIEATARSRLVVSAFFVNDAMDFNTLKIMKITYHKTYGWRSDGEIRINNFQARQMKEFVSVLSSLNLSDTGKTKISLQGAHIELVDTIMRTDLSADWLKRIADSPELSADIFALAHKKQELATFEWLLNGGTNARSEYVDSHSLGAPGEESVWQHFFERNAWIFGHGLNYVFLDKVGQKLEAVTTGFSHEQPGKRVDGLLRTRAAISQYVLIEIKTPSAPLLKPKEYRSGCWSVNGGVCDAVTQIQKTVFDFTHNQFQRVDQTDDEGSRTGLVTYRTQPKSYLVIGNLAELDGNDDKVACFELFRRSLSSPEIITFDELYERAKCIVETISYQQKVFA